MLAGLGCALKPRYAVVFAVLEAVALLRGLAGLDFRGMDIVEVAPAYDHAELTSNAAAQFVWTYLCSQVAKAARHAV